MFSESEGNQDAWWRPQGDESQILARMILSGLSEEMASSLGPRIITANVVRKPALCQVLC